MSKFVCSVCGYVYEGEAAPKECPICHAPAEKFNKVEETAITWADEHKVGVAEGLDEEVVAGLRENFNGECSEVGMYLAMARVAYREGYPEVGMYYEKAAYEEAEHAAKFAELLGQTPSMRMMVNSGRKRLYNDPNLKGIIYHTVKFCDFYSFEYAQVKQNITVPLLKIESDYTVQSSGQLLTRLEAFAESMNMDNLESGEKKMGKGYFAGIDSGSTSTDVVILNKDGEIVTGIILPTGAGAAMGAERALEEALKQAKLQREDIDAMVTTGYGRTAITDGDKSITEITCHARGAHFLNPEVRTGIDIGGQDSKVIRLDENGAVANFVMNDKCAAGTGRFLEMMARTMEMDLDQMSEAGLTYKEDITISSMCTVFAESEVVSLIAQNKETDDIVHGLNKAVASKTAALAKRVGGEERYMMTGGVSKNKGLVKTLEEKLGTTLVIFDKAQFCGALGAALFAMDMVQK